MFILCQEKREQFWIKVINFHDYIDVLPISMDNR